MKIATYNVWNNDIDIRTEQLIQEIDLIDVDIIGLQEVPQCFFTQLIERSRYTYHVYCKYQGQNEGLAFLGKYPLSTPVFLNEKNEFDNSLALSVIIKINDIRFSVTNVHLPWDSVLAKERQIVAIDRFIREMKDHVDFSILLGDFNCTGSSSVHHFLLGDQTILGCEAKPYWNDLASVHAALNNYNVVPTLDFINNPRWGGKNTNYIPDTCDRILIKESYNWDFEFKLRKVNIFGKDVSSKTGFAPSDHYGLLAEVEFTK
ncbi:MAG: endonuclease/exonuclease/phosphatase family protein [Treponema sp.]|jgi:endonuclease/exonuclease/phosphatase family metal-dependent hydrolase|nr:endonuclease/exonuclease/phosphatase family protein [Treponema sp.]